MSQWKSKMGFIFAAIGSAVGLGNIWRFPMAVQENGGGAYLIPYLTVTFIFGLSLMVVEISTGARFGTNIVSAFERMKSGYLGLFITFVSIIVISYYLVLTGWVLGYTWHFLTNNPTKFSNFTSGTTPLLFFVISLLIAAGIIGFGIEDGIERAVTIFIPMIFITLVGLVLYSITLDGFMDGLRYFLEPDFSVLSNPAIWDDAFGQAFFSLSIGQALLFTYGTYLDSEEGLIKTSAIITVSNFFVAFLVGLIIFPMVFTFGSGTDSLGAGRQLAFVTLP
ncbi:MAG: sodium-dependent transporter [Halobacteria archaeon]